jgi:hypothetical protein
MSINGVGPTFDMRPGFEETFIRPYYLPVAEALPPIGRLMGFDNTPIKPPSMGEWDGSANLLTRMGVDRAADYSLAVAEQHAPSGRLNILA